MIEELKTAKEAMGLEHEKVADVCRGLQQLLDSTNALLKRAVGEVDGYSQRAEESNALRIRAEEVWCRSCSASKLISISRRTEVCSVNWILSAHLSRLWRRPCERQPIG